MPTFSHATQRYAIYALFPTKTYNLLSKKQAVTTRHAQQTPFYTTFLQRFLAN